MRGILTSKRGIASLAFQGRCKMPRWDYIGDGSIVVGRLGMLT
jgi:hypothetical protein